MGFWEAWNSLLGREAPAEEKAKPEELSVHERRDLLRKQRGAEAILRAIKKDGRVWFPPNHHDDW